MKEMEYTVKIVTEGPVEQGTLLAAIKTSGWAKSVEITNYRVLPRPKVKQLAE